MHVQSICCVRWLFLGIFTWLWIGASQVLAAPVTVTSVQRGIKRGYGLLYSKGKKQEALRTFEKVQADIQSLLRSTIPPEKREKLLHLSTSAFFLEGQASSHLKRWKAAVFAYRRALATKPSVKLKEVIQKVLKNIYKQRGATLSVSVLPRSSFIEILYPQGWLNETHNARAIRVIHGNVTIRISYRGYKSLKRILRVVAGKNLYRIYELQRKKSPSRRVVTSLPKRRLPPGKRHKTPTKAGQLSPKKTKSIRKGLLIAGVATVGVAAVAAGLGAMLMVKGKNQFYEHYGNPAFLGAKEAEAAEKRSEAKEMQIGGVVMLITGGITALVGLTLMAKSMPSKTQKISQIQSQMPPSPAMASQGTFSLSWR